MVTPGQEGGARTGDEEGFALVHAAETLKGDKGVVLAAVTSEGFALEHRTRVWCDKEVVHAAEPLMLIHRQGCGPCPGAA